MITIVFSVIIVLACILLIASVLMQEGQKQGLGAISGASETFFGKNKSTGMDAMLRKVTAGTAAAIILLSVILNCL